MFAAMFIMTCRFDLEAKLPQIRKEIEERKEKEKESKGEDN